MTTAKQVQEASPQFAPGVSVPPDAVSVVAELCAELFCAAPDMLNAALRTSRSARRALDRVRRREQQAHAQTAVRRLLVARASGKVEVYIGAMKGFNNGHGRTAACRRCCAVAGCGQPRHAVVRFDLHGG